MRWPYQAVALAWPCKLDLSEGGEVTLGLFKMFTKKVGLLKKNECERVVRCQVK